MPEPIVDAQPPTLSYIGFGQRYVDTSAGDTAVNFYVLAWDQSGTASGAASFTGPGGAWTTVQLKPSDERNVLEGSVPVPDTTPPGDYRLTSLTLTDSIGNTGTVGAAKIGESSYQPEFEVFEGPDETAPELTSFSISPTSVDTSGAPATIEITIGARDDVSGVNGVIPGVALPNWEPSGIEATSVRAGEESPATGTRHNGTWTRSYQLVEHAMPGIYKVRNVYLSDLAGNTRRYKAAELEALGYNTEFEETGPGDTTGPEIVDFWFEPDHISWSAEEPVYFYSHVRDDLAGLGQFPNEGLSGVWVGESPAHPVGTWSAHGTVPKLVSGTELDGIWKQEWIPGDDAPIDEYKIDYLGAQDRAGNETHIGQAEIEANGWPRSFLVEP